MNENEILSGAIAHYGELTQMVKTCEELAELQQAICKYINAANPPQQGAALDHIFEEMADVEIMLEQLKLIFGYDFSTLTINGWKQRKMERLIKRIEEEDHE